MRLSSSNPLTYLRSWNRGKKARHYFANVRSYVMFIGQPRSGTSLLGSLLDAHRNMLVAQELNALKYLRKGYSKDQIFWLIFKNENMFAQNGRRWTGYEYNVNTEWQGHWEDLYVIGDKKAGRSTEELRANPDLLHRLEKSVGIPVRIVHIIRNPFNVITTIHRKVKNTSLHQAADMFFRRTETNWKLMQERGDQIHTFRLEDFIGATQSHLKKLCDFLEVPADEDYITACSKVVFAKPRQSMFDVNWPGDLVDSIREKMALYPFLNGYEFRSLEELKAA